MYAASAIAVNTVARSACGAAAPLFTNYMFEALGIGGGGSLIGGVATVLAVIPFAFYKYGERIRIRSKFAPTGPKKPDDEEAQRHDEKREEAGVPRNDPQPMLSSSSSTVIDEGERGEKRRESQDDDVQNDPRVENVEFGKEQK